MSFKVSDHIGITTSGIVVVMILSSFVNSQQSDLICGRSLFIVDACPQYTDPPTTRNQEQCENDGCYYCTNYLEQCIEGPGCATINLTPDNECFDAEGFRIFDRTSCRASGCSWCDKHPGFKCFKNPTSQNDIITPPLSSGLNCGVDEAQRVECDHLIPGRKMFRSSCWLSGCHWCGGDLPCIQGQVCSTAKSTGEYDCRNDPNEVLSRHECLLRGCSWCPNNAAFKCVRDLPAGVGPFDLTCRRNVNDYFECPTYAGSPTVRNEQQCKDDGCYYCDSLATKCVQGTGCSWINMVTANECKTLSGNAISNRKVCRDEGCSWCEHHSGIKCFKNAVTAEEVVSAPPPYPAACSSSPRVECSYLQPMYSGSPAQCWLSGCHWCPATNEPISCVRGEVCATQQSGEEYDCRNTPTESLSPYECIQRGCSWCAANTVYKCVRNLPDTPLQECPGSLHCFSSSILVGITEAQCNKQYRCSFCNSTDLTRTCMRDTCPPGYVLRYDGESCCRSTTTIGIESPRVARIINGDVVPDDDFTWAVFYRFEIVGLPPRFCGAFVVAPKIVLTAAHCQIRDSTTFEIIGPGTGFIIAGAKNLISASSDTYIGVAEAIPHPLYSDILFLHDVMILKLWDEVPSTVKPIQLPMGETPFVGTNCFVAGYGVTNSTTFVTSATLLQATAIILPATTCQKNLTIPFDDEFLLCAGGTEQSFCAGDSGGALMCQRCSNCDWYAVGIGSFGLDPDCSPALPTYYAKVDSYQSFLKKHGVPIGSHTFTCDI